MATSSRRLTGAVVLALFAAVIVAPPASAQTGGQVSGETRGVPVTGDWNGDGTTTAGWFHRGTWVLSDSPDGSDPYQLTYGRAGDVPVTGDWNGDGRDTIGVVRNGEWILRYEYRRGADIVFDLAIEVVSSFTTPLVPGQARNTNIHLAADYIDGDVIAPGESYSLNAGIGERTTARGFVPNGFIDYDGELISVVGGGVSQMGTTFINAAWFAGIQLDEFQPHSIYFERYPMCREATLTWNVVDVVVTNDSPYEITIETSHTPSSVTVSLVSRPWADVDSWIGQPFDVVGGLGGAFSVRCGRTVTYPVGTSSSDTYSWRYDEGYPG